MGDGSAATPTRRVFSSRLKRRLPDLRDVHAVVLGAGGAARAVALALRTRGRARRHLWPPPASGARCRARNRRGGGGLAAAAAFLGCPRERDAGRQPCRAGESLRRPLDGRVVYDLIYDPDPTELMRAAADAGRIVDRGSRDARRPGRAAVRDLDRTAAAGRIVCRGGSRRYRRQSGGSRATDERRIGATENDG